MPRILSTDAVRSVAPVLYQIGDYGELLCNIVYAVVLLFLRSTSSSYKRAGVFYLIAGGITILLAIVFTLLERSLPTFLALPVLILILMSEYHEFKAHSEVLEGVDYVLSEKWTKLWRGYVLALFAVMCSNFVFLPFISTLVTLASAIAIVVFSIMKYCYLYRTATVFRTYQREQAENGTDFETIR